MDRPYLPYLACVLDSVSFISNGIATFKWGRMLKEIYRRRKMSANNRPSNLFVSYLFMAFIEALCNFIHFGYLVFMWRPSKVLLQ